MSYKDTKKLIAMLAARINTPPEFHDDVQGGKEIKKQRPAVIKDDVSSIRSDQHRVGILLECFKSMPTSPKYAGVHKTIYVKNKTCHDDLILNPKAFFSPTGTFMEENVVNAASVNVEDLVHALCEQAIIVANSPGSPLTPLLLTGNRGSGKTAWLSYIISTCHTIFNQHKVIVVRMDMTKKEAINYSLKEFQAVQTYAILCTHYLGGGGMPIKRDYFVEEDYQHALETWKYRSEKHPVEKLRDFLKEKRNNEPHFKKTINGILYNSTGEERNDAELLDLNISLHEKITRLKQYKEFIEDEGYSFIYIFDGLDESAIPLIDAQKLEKWGNELESLYVGREFVHGFYILCTRTESQSKIASSSLQLCATDATTASPVRTMVVFGVDPIEILKKRLAFTKEKINTKSKKWKTDLWTEASLDKIYDLTMEAITAALEPLGFELKEILSALTDPGHMRSFLKFFREAMWETIAILDEHYGESNVEFWFPTLAETKLADPEWKKLLKRKAYRIWQLSSLNYDINFGESLHTYSGEIGSPRPVNKEGEPALYHSTEWPLIPIAWGDVPCQAQDISQGNHNHLLSKLRIYQFLNFHTSALSVGEICDGLFHLFSFDPACTRYHIRAMILQGLLDVSAQGGGFVALEKTLLRTTRLGRLIMEKAVTNYSYIESTINYAWVPENVSDKFPWVQKRRRKGASSNMDGLPTNDYMIEFFYLLINFVGFVEATEAFEKSRLIVANRKISGTDKNHLLNIKFNFISSEMKTSINRTIRRIINAAARNADPALFNAIKNEFWNDLEQNEDIGKE
ncbi:hypothetical protein [uncultured Desulfuromusa sp.]|uniref:hypothetical protein n=1 Tax=uncultured Desulfuromusa sp. TaxID=219183 RepID=UPI002AA7EF9F|nr:hypothetical protein [uncultured Desulfuromusa sp.]